MTDPAAPHEIDLNPHDREEIRRVLNACIPQYEVWAFGSRVRGTSKPYSDLDIVIISDTPLSLATMAELRDTLDQSDLTIKVDVVDWAATNPSFRSIIQQDKVIVQQGTRALKVGP